MNGHEPTPGPSQEGNKLTAQVEKFLGRKRAKVSNT